jgi:hypothetical protein
MFFNFVNLRSLYIQNNNLQELLNGVFHNKTNLEVLYIYNNNIRQLNLRQFGGATNNLRILYGANNRINEIEEELFDALGNLEFFMLSDNICVDEDFFGVPDNIEDVRFELRRCFENFRNEPSINCVFESSLDDFYMCFLYTHNTFGIEFENISGNHTSGQSDDNVEVISAVYQNSR